MLQASGEQALEVVCTPEQVETNKKTTAAFAINLILFIEKRRRFGITTPWRVLDVGAKVWLLDDVLRANRVRREMQSTLQPKDLEENVIAAVDGFYKNNATERLRIVRDISTRSGKFSCVDGMLDAMFHMPTFRRFHYPCPKCADAFGGLYMQVAKNCYSAWECPCRQ